MNFSPVRMTRQVVVHGPAPSARRRHFVRQRTDRPAQGVYRRRIWRNAPPAGVLIHIRTVTGEAPGPTGMPGDGAFSHPPAGTVGGVSPPSTTQPLRAVCDQPRHDMAEADWDSLYHAVTDRLRLTVVAVHSGDPIRTSVLECVEALDQLHVELMDQRRWRVRIEPA